MPWDSAHGGAMHAEAPFCNAILELVQERNPLRRLIDSDLHPHVSDLWMARKLLGEGMVMRGKKPYRANVRRNVM